MDARQDRDRAAADLSNEWTRGARKNLSRFIPLGALIVFNGDFPWFDIGRADFDGLVTRISVKAANSKERFFGIKVGGLAPRTLRTTAEFATGGVFRRPGPVSIARAA